MTRRDMIGIGQDRIGEDTRRDDQNSKDISQHFSELMIKIQRIFRNIFPNLRDIFRQVIHTSRKFISVSECIRTFTPSSEYSKSFVRRKSELRRIEVSRDSNDFKINILSLANL